MREKYNAVYLNSINHEISYIQKYLGAEIETILNPDASSIHGVDFDSIYVNMPAVEAKLVPLKNKISSDRCLFLTGLTGCGKSSMLNHIFHINEKNIYIDKESLYISISFDHAIAARSKEQIQTYFMNQIKNACDKIRKVVDEKNLPVNNNGLYKYI